MGSEMCIRDRASAVDDEVVKAAGHEGSEHAGSDASRAHHMTTALGLGGKDWHCLLYTSDAADERSSVDLGGRRIIKKKKT